MIKIDPTISLGTLIAAFSMLLTLVGFWLRSEKLLATLSVRVGSAEKRLDTHDELHRDADEWRLNHVTNHKSA